MFNYSVTFLDFENHSFTFDFFAYNFIQAKKFVEKFFNKLVFKSYKLYCDNHLSYSYPNIFKEL